MTDSKSPVRTFYQRSVVIFCLSNVSGVIEGFGYVGSPALGQIFAVLGVFDPLPTERRVQPIVMIFGTVGDLADVSNRAKFFV